MNCLKLTDLRLNKTYFQRISIKLFFLFPFIFQTNWASTRTDTRLLPTKWTPHSPNWPATKQFVSHHFLNGQHFHLMTHLKQKPNIFDDFKFLASFIHIYPTMLNEHRKINIQNNAHHRRCRRRCYIHKHTHSFFVTI